MYKSYVLTPSEVYGVFEISGTVTEFEEYKEEKNIRNGLTCRSCSLILNIGNNIEIPFKISAYSDKVSLYQRVVKFYESLSVGDYMRFSGNIRCVGYNQLEFAIFRYGDSGTACNKIYQPIVFNKIDGNMLCAYIMQGTGKKHSTYIYETDFPKVPRLQRGDAIIAEGKISSKVILTGFVPNTWEKQKYDESLFKDDAVRSLFNGSDPDLARII